MSTKTDIWMPFYVADYLADTMHLTAAEHGGYLLLIMHYWKTGPIPLDDERLATISRLGSAWPASARTIKEFFEERDGFLVHGRIDAERAMAAGNKSKKAAAGSSGAKAKWGDTAAENRATRSERLAAARRLATHSAAEWLTLREVCGCCVKCGSTGELVKDHITPLYQGGSDGIENIQPLCRSCNAAKGPETVDYRPVGWRDALAKRLANACQTSGPSPSPSPSTNVDNPLPPDAGAPGGVERRSDVLEAIEKKLPAVSKPRKLHGTEEDHTAARWIFEQVRKVSPTAQEPSWAGWANDVRLMREIDGRTHKEICELFAWATKDSFWCVNILSPSKLREKWGTLAARRDQPAQGSARPGGRPSINSFGPGHDGGNDDPFNELRRAP